MSKSKIICIVDDQPVETIVVYFNSWIECHRCSSRDTRGRIASDSLLVNWTVRHGAGGI